MKIILDLTVHMNKQKITTIKALREILGFGLVEAKAYVENYDGYLRSVIVNAEQLGRLYIVSAELASKSDGPFGNTPVIYFDKAHRFDTPHIQSDFSDIR